MFIRFDTIHETQTHGRTDTAWRHRPRLHSIARQNDMHIQLSLSLHFYLHYLFLNSCDGNDAILTSFYRCWPTFSKSLVVSVAVSTVGCTELFFVEPWVNVDGAYYREVLPKQQMLAVMRRIAGNTFVFQPHSTHPCAPCSWNRPAPPAGNSGLFILFVHQYMVGNNKQTLTANRLDLNPVDCRIWVLMQERMYKTPVRDKSELKQRLNDAWTSISQNVIDEAVGQWTKRLHMHAWRRKDITLNMC